MSESTGTGKIERLPWEIREQVCRKLRDNVPGVKIIAWLHTLPEVLQVLDEQFGEEPISPQNLSNFKANGYRRWLARQGNIDRTRELANYSIELAKASGGNLADGAAQIVAGNILEVLEQLDALTRSATADGDDPNAAKERLAATAEAIDGLALAISRLRKGDQNAEALKLARERLAQTEKDRQLAEKKFKESLRTKLQAGLDEIADAFKGNPQAMDFYQKARELIGRES